MILFFLILVSFILGFSFCFALFRNTAFYNLRILFNLSIPIGIGVSSIVFVLLSIMDFTPLLILFVQIILILFLFYNNLKSKPYSNYTIINGGISNLKKQVQEPIFLLLIIIYIYAWITNAGIFFFDSVKEPHGLWDAFNYWNLKAKIINRSPNNWPALFHQMVSEDFHPDYPLLQTGYIAYCWTFLKNESVWVPITISFIFTFCTIGLLSASVSFFTNRIRGLIAGLTLLCTPFYMTMGDSQYADITVGFFYLATVVLLTLARDEPIIKLQLLIAAGITASLCGWSKNEGLLFIACLIISQLTLFPVKNTRELMNEIKYLILGILPVLLIILYYKMRIAPSNDILKAQGEKTLTKLTDCSRYATIAKWYISTIASFGKWMVNPWWFFLFGVLYKGINIKKMFPGMIANYTLLVLMLVGFFFIYIVTPLNLEFHLSTSLHRLFFQLFPTFIFLYFLSIGNRTSIT